MSIKPFDPTATCPKCGHNTITTTYIGHRPYIFGNNVDDMHGEHLRRHCERCTYGRNEAVLKDAKRETHEQTQAPELRQDQAQGAESPRA